mmetsp:Transcript_29727/g.49061  ORF Transcript_29727/g.49061 Transcript_29727/m.49061 type:complete len:354 (-) Transcript_29727:221-1282(-)|eukprot:CAMPEP_0119015316 /NCGR_PEP_ID=MMETSP1176-20130426/10793_1 /TAXON_ID=265551 /ORGANISM="Synedropsis recta cf, Strain CCMP1620" /LENGTH=353 /DNA_ID=CAMNT_0006968595 /DNA_START=41 /DNA_END=1102 /DNA_ORIENTATION=+
MSSNVRHINTKKAFNTTITSEDGHFGYLDNGSDTFAIGGDAWVIQSTTGREVCVTGCYREDTLRTNVKIGTGLTAINLPDGVTIIGRANEATILGEKANSLFAESQMEANGVILRKTIDGKRYLQVDGYVIPVTTREAMLTIPIHKPSEEELRTCPVVDLTENRPWNPETYSESQVSSEEYSAMMSEVDTTTRRRHVNMDGSGKVMKKRAASITEKAGDDNYRVELETYKQRVRVLENRALGVQLLKRANDDEKGVERHLSQWNFESVADHQWSPEADRKGKIDVLVKWVGYEKPTWEPMEVIQQDDPVTLAKYADEHGLLDQLLWQWARRYVKKSNLSQQGEEVARRWKSSY